MAKNTIVFLCSDVYRYQNVKCSTARDIIWSTSTYVDNVGFESHSDFYTTRVKYQSVTIVLNDSNFYVAPTFWSFGILLPNLWGESVLIPQQSWNSARLIVGADQGQCGSIKIQWLPRHRLFPIDWLREALTVKKRQWDSFAGHVTISRIYRRVGDILFLHIILGMIIFNCFDHQR